MAIREGRVAQAFVELADTLVDDYDVADLLHTLAEQCVRLLDAAAAGLLLADQRGSLQVLASSSEGARLLELFQLQTEEGPCVECFHTQAPVLVADIAAQSHRWPQFAAAASREGFVSVHALPLRLRTQTIGALNLFGRERGALSEEDLRLGQALADTATIGILQERAIHHREILVEQLQTALNSRVIIEQAKGVLATVGNLDMGAAFIVLRTYARNHSARLSEVARDLVERDLDATTVLAGHLAPRPTI
ncbi:MAG: transcriptional regulator [Acidimicrobiales bacterium]|nr:MAG: transcriptional regulator [Acidimicrobiales bacterium]